MRLRGVEVDQTLRRTTGKRPDFGKLQMRRGLLPAAAENEERIRSTVERALDDVAAASGF